MFARSTTWRQGEGRTWQNATSIRKTFPSRASRLEGLTSRWAIPAFHSLRTMDSASRIMSRLTSASRISVPRGPERLHPGHADAQLIGKSRADGLAPRPVRSEEHTSELQSHVNLVCRLLLEKKKNKNKRGRGANKKKKPIHQQ